MWAVSRQAGIERADLLSPRVRSMTGSRRRCGGVRMTRRARFYVACRKRRSVAASGADRAGAQCARDHASPACFDAVIETELSDTDGGCGKAGVDRAAAARPTDCVSLTIEQPGTKAGQHSALGDVNLYSDLDGGDAVALLIGQLGSTDTRSAEAAERRCGSTGVDATRANRVTFAVAGGGRKDRQGQCASANSGSAWHIGRAVVGDGRKRIRPR